MTTARSRLASGELRRLHQHPCGRIEHHIRRRAIGCDIEPLTRLRELDPLDLRYLGAIGKETNFQRKPIRLSLLRLRELNDDLLSGVIPRPRAVERRNCRPMQPLREEPPEVLTRRFLERALKILARREAVLMVAIVFSNRFPKRVRANLPPQHVEH